MIKDILEVANHVEVTEVEMKGRDGEVIFQDNHYDVSPPEILEHFARKWRSRGVSLAFILHSARESVFLYASSF